MGATTTPEKNDLEEELVPGEAACPRCRERRMANLRLRGDDVDCLICGCHYSLPEDDEPEENT